MHPGTLEPCELHFFAHPHVEAGKKGMRDDAACPRLSILTPQFCSLVCEAYKFHKPVEGQREEASDSSLASWDVVECTTIWFS